VTSPLRLVTRTLTIWAIEAAGLYLMLRFLPNVRVSRWEVAILAVFVIGLLNALVRPAVLMLVANLGIIPFLIVALLLNGLLVMVAGWIVPGFDAGGPLTAFLVAFGLAALNAIFTALLSIEDDDSFYRNVVRRLARRMAPEGELYTTGTVVIQIDGLAEPILRRALAEGRMPTLAAWLAAGTHRLVPWECEVPSMTTSAQAGILHGNTGEIPAFYWYEKRAGRLRSSADPRDLHDVQRRLSDGRGLLHDDGVSVTNLFGGDAARTIMTVGTFLDDDGSIQASPHDFYGYLLNPYNLYRGIVGMIGEAILDTWQALRQWLRNEQPRIRRLGLFTFQRGAATVILRDATTWTVVASMYQGHRVIYCDYLGYDEVGHFAGPETRDAVATLTSIDRQIRQVALAASQAPRPYQVVVLSDHGQTTAPIFDSVYGRGLDALVRDVIDAGPTLRLAGGNDEAAGWLRAFLNELAGHRGLQGRGARRLLRSRRGSGLIDPVGEYLQREQADEAEVVVTSSGSLAHIYFARVPERLSLEEIAAAYPALIPALVAHEGIGLVLVRSESRGAIVLSRLGIRELEPGRDRVVEGTDPLAAFSRHAPRFLCLLAAFEHSGDIVVNGKFDPSTNWVIGFDDLVGAHGGLGGMQTQPFLIYPADWTDTSPELVGSVDVHQFLRRHTSNDPATERSTVDNSHVPGALAGWLRDSRPQGA
jgi:uncharacterized membrane protein YvlD (DUF360 family)